MDKLHVRVLSNNIPSEFDVPLPFNLEVAPEVYILNHIINNYLSMESKYITNSTSTGWGRYGI